MSAGQRAGQPGGGRHWAGLVLGLVCGLAVAAVALTTAVSWASFDRGYYRATYSRLDTAADIGISHEDLERATDVLLDYLAGRRADLDVEVTRLADGETFDLFNAREREHMVDVQQLYLAALRVRAVALALVLACLLVVVALGRRGELAFWLRQLHRGMLVAIALLALAIAALAVWAIVDFPRFWTQFHLIFFNNDLWILNPATDMLIRMVPEPFFYGLVLRIIVATVAAIASAVALVGLLEWGARRREGTLRDEAKGGARRDGDDAAPADERTIT